MTLRKPRPAVSLVTLFAHLSVGVATSIAAVAPGGAGTAGAPGAAQPHLDGTSPALREAYQSPACHQRWSTEPCAAAERRVAEAGDGRAMANHGWRHVVRLYGMYAQRTGVRQNDAEAVRWFRLGAAAGDGRAMANLGIMYELGKGVEQDDAEAVRWYRRGADAGYGRAMANLAVMHLSGRGGLKRDDEAAANFLQAAAKLGDGRAMTHLALLHFEGRGVPQSDALGLRWVQSARRNGDPAGYYYLGVLHAAGGAGLKKDPRAARGELGHMLGLAGCSAGNVPRPSCIRSDELGISVGDIGTGSPISLYEAANRQYLALGREMGLDVPGWTEAEARGALVLVLILASLVGSGTDSARPPRDHLRESLERNQRELECRLSGGTPLGDYCDRK